MKRELKKPQKVTGSKKGNRTGRGQKSENIGETWGVSKRKEKGKA